MRRLIQQDEANNHIMLAWRIEQIRILTMANKRMPDPRTLLLGQAPPAKRRQTPAEQRFVLQTLSAQYGIPLQEIGGQPN